MFSDARERKTAGLSTAGSAEVNVLGAFRSFTPRRDGKMRVWREETEEKTRRRSAGAAVIEKDAFRKWFGESVWGACC